MSAITVIILVLYFVIDTFVIEGLYRFTTTDKKKKALFSLLGKFCVSFPTVLNIYHSVEYESLLKKTICRASV